MKLISCVAALGAVALLGPALLQGATAEDAATAKAALKDAKGQDVGVASFTQTMPGPSGTKELRTATPTSGFQLPTIPGAFEGYFWR